MFVCDLVATIKVCQGNVYNMYCGQIFRFIINHLGHKIIVRVQACEHLDALDILFEFWSSTFSLNA